MSARDMIVEAAFLAAKSGSQIYKEKGMTQEAILLVHRFDEIALQLFELAKRLDKPNPT